MLSTLHSFLPPALQLGGSQDRAPKPTVDDSSQSPPHTESPTQLEHDIHDSGKSPGVDELGVRKKKERTHESFIVVRPPPSKTNHPLNLQVQLVPPSSRAPLPRTSFSSATSAVSPPIVSPDSVSSASENPLARTTSNRSDVSAYSSFTSFSTASTSSFSSVTSNSTTSTSGGGRRMIIPLYNLQAHNVMTNVIVDAGTDAKIAKFHKRGLEIIGLAMLEVVETLRGMSWTTDDRHASGHGHQITPSADGHTPTSSHVSLNSDATQESPPLSHQSAPLTPQHTPQPEKSGARRLFGKVFKRKGDANGSPQPNSPYLNSPSNRSPLPTLDRDAAQSTTPKAPSKRSSLLMAAAAHTQSPSDQQGSPAPGAQTQQQQQTVLGIQPTMYTGVSGPDSARVRSTRYVWVVRKWLKGPPTGVTLPAVGLVAGQGVIDSLMEVSFEWTRSISNRTHVRKGKGKDSKDARGKRRSGTGASSNTPSMSSLKKGRTSESRGRRSVEIDGDAGRQRARSPASVHTDATNTTDDGSPRRHGDDDDDSDSDPEDSETPWTCQLVVRRLQASPVHRLSHLSEDGRTSPAPANGSSGDVKVKVAAVVPAPHHPKVVSLLKIPFPLPDIIVSSKAAVHHTSPHLHPQLSLRPSHGRDIEIEVEARKRVVTPSGVARPAAIGTSASPPATPTQAAVSSGSTGAGLNKLAGKLKSSITPALAGVHIGNGFSSEGSESTRIGGEGVLLSAEEIKDIVCCTALWVVVREGFGGVGKVNRKGDGWRIRG